MAFSSLRFKGKVTFDWTLNGFKNLSAEWIESPIIKPPPPQNHVEYTVSLLPQEAASDFVSVKLQWTGPRAVPLEVTYKLRLIDRENQVRDDFSFKGSSKKGSSYQWIKRADLLDEKQGLLSSGNLRIRGEIFYEKGNRGGVDLPQESDIFADLETLLRDEFLSDVILRVEDHEIKAHKAILAARSRVFRAMFRPDTKESNEGVVEMKGISHEVVKGMVTYIYANRVDPDMCCFDLLNGAEMYDLKKLKLICECKLASRLTIENVVESFVEADKYAANILKEAALEFMARNVKEVKETVDWKENMPKDLKRDVMDAVFDVTYGSKVNSSTVRNVCRRIYSKMCI